MTTPSLIKLQAPVSDEALLTTREKIILLQGSKLHGCVFPPWKGDPSQDEFHAGFEDASEFRFSKEQLEDFAGWQRRPSLLPEYFHVARDKVDLVQDITTDCSVVASLCADYARAESLGHGHEPITSTQLHPKDRPSRNGKYILKLNFNGCFRKVVIDDRLPTSNSARSLHILDRRNPDNLWPALIEKAYLKVRGGYDFPGSNSGTDLSVLTGWIPEQIFLQSDDIVPGTFWRRIFNAFNYSDVLLTVGTPKMTPLEERSLGLSGEHDYAVINMKEEDGRRTMLVKNPWSEGGIWLGSAQSSDDDSSIGGNILDPGDHCIDTPKSHPATEGTFWMDLHEVFRRFETIYLNWNPGLFKHRRDAHFIWNLKSRSPPGSFLKNPQYLISCGQGCTVWILLSRHFEDPAPKGEGQLLIKSSDTPSRFGFLSLYAFGSSYRITLTDGFIQRSPYVDSPNTLLRFDIPAETHYAVVVSEQDSPQTSHTFTLSVFSNSPLTTFRNPPEKYTYTISIAGAWTTQIAGGNANSPTYHTNPQYSLMVPHTTDLALLLTTSEQNLAVHVKLVWAGGQRITSAITSRDIFGDSGEYRRGCSLAEVEGVPSGKYTIVCSTFAQGQLGDFELRVQALVPDFIVKPIPLYEAGMLKRTLPPAIFTQGLDRLLAPITVTRTTRLSVVAQTERVSSQNSPITVQIEHGQGPSKRVLVSTGEPVDKMGGLETEYVNVQPGLCCAGGPGLWLVIERIGGSYVLGAEKVLVEVLCSERGLELGPWGKEADAPIEELSRQVEKW